jgi:putative nucleotidyltransferase-like protein
VSSGPEERLQRWLRTYDSQDLWPGSTSEQRVTAYAGIVHAAEQVLAGAPATLTAVGPSEVNATGIAAFMAGVGALLGWWIERGQLEASPPLSSLFAEHLAQGRRRARHMEQRLSTLVRALTERRVVPVVLKGTHVGRRYFEDPGVRPTGDIDLLVSRTEADAVAEVLRSRGLQRSSGHALPHREDWRPPQAPLLSLEMMCAENPWAVDIHYSLDRTYFPGLTAGFGVPEPSQLESWTGPFGSVRVLAQPLLAAQLAVHASADFPDIQLVRVIELIHVLRADLKLGRLDWPRLMALLRQTSTRRFAYTAFAMASRIDPGVVDPAFLGELSRAATSRMRATLPHVLLVPPQHFEPRSLQMRLAWAKGPWQVTLNLLEWFYPTGPMIDHATRWRIWRRRLELLLRGRFRWTTL